MGRRAPEAVHATAVIIASVLLGMLGALAAPVHGEQPRPLDLSGLGAPTFTTFTGRDGVPETTISSIAVDAEGFVWLASPLGLARYDGHHWAAPTRGVEGQIADLHVDLDRKLWVSLLDRGLARRDGADWRLFDRATELSTQHVRRMLETRDRAGRATNWILTSDDGLIRREGERFVSDPANDSVPRGQLLALAATQDLGGSERLWLGTGTEGVWYREGAGPWERFRAPGFDASQVEDLLVTREQGREELWIGAFGVGLWRLTDAGLTSWTVKSGDLRSDRVYRLAATERPDGHRVLWAATRAGLVRVDGERAQIFDRRHGLPSDVIRDLKVWRSPSGAQVLWMATEGGVARTITGASPWQAASLLGVNSIGVFSVLVEPDGAGGERLWVGSTQDGLGLYEKGRWRTFSRATGDLPESDVLSIRRVRDPKGGSELWVGMSGGPLLRVREGPRFEPQERPWSDRPGEAAMDVLARTVDGAYERWVGTRLSGVYRWREGRWTAFQAEGAVQPWRIVNLVEQIDRTGRSWLWATSDQGLARFDGERWKLLGLEEDLPDPELLAASLLTDRESRQVLWVGSRRGGLRRYDVTDPLAPRRLLGSGLPKSPDPTVYSALADSMGHVYVATNAGVQLLTPRRGGGYTERVFSRSDGMMHEECNTNAQLVDAHDRYWTGTLGGLAVYSPDADVPDRQPKPLRLTHVLLDGREATAAALRVPFGVRELRFDYGLLAWWREAESRYRSQLVDYESGPSAWSAQPFRIFGVLPPGRYLMRVEARDHAGVASAPLEIPVEVLPAWWQTTWFRALLVAFFALAGPSFYLHRVRRLSRQKAELELLVNARTGELAAANARLADLSRQDALTGVANRRRLDEALDEEWRRAVRLRMPLSVILLDVDHFKEYNDGQGHQAGDRCLAAVAMAVAEGHARAGELVARYGGEEFAVVIPGATLEAGYLSAEKARRRVEALGLPHPTSNAGSVVTVSVGVAAASPADGGSVEDLVRGADQALYAAKSAGRNCVRTTGGVE